MIQITKLTPLLLTVPLPLPLLLFPHSVRDTWLQIPSIHPEHNPCHPLLYSISEFIIPHRSGWKSYSKMLWWFLFYYFWCWTVHYCLYTFELCLSIFSSSLYISTSSLLLSFPLRTIKIFHATKPSFFPSHPLSLLSHFILSLSLVLFSEGLCFGLHNTTLGEVTLLHHPSEIQSSMCFSLVYFTFFSLHPLLSFFTTLFCILNI